MKKWKDLGRVYSTNKMEQMRAIFTESGIRYKVHPMVWPGAPYMVMQCYWHIYVKEQDMDKAQHLLQLEGDF